MEALAATFLPSKRPTSSSSPLLHHPLRSLNHPISVRPVGGGPNGGKLPFCFEARLRAVPQDGFPGGGEEGVSGNGFCFLPEEDVASSLVQVRWCIWFGLWFVSCDLVALFVFMCKLGFSWCHMIIFSLALVLFFLNIGLVVFFFFFWLLND